VRIGVLGGSFDPVHHGHLIAAQVLREQLGLDEVRLIPAAAQPFRVGQHVAGPADRAAMVGLAVAGMPGLALDRAEVDRGEGPSYTVETLELLTRREPGVEWTLLVGADAAAQLPRWHEAERIPSLARVVVFARGGALPVPGAIEVPAIAISSTAVRERVRAGRSIRYWVPEAVEGYLTARRLYRDGPS